MKTKKNILFTVLIFTIYIATVLTYAISLLAEYRTGPERADFRISELIRETRQNAQTNLPGSDSFNSALIHSMSNTSDLAGLQVLKDGKLIFSYPKDLSESKAGSSSLVRVKSEKIKGKDGSELTLTAAVYLVTPESISIKGLIAFAVILLTTVGAIIHLILLYRTEKLNETPSQTSKAKDDSESDDYFDDELLEEDSQRIENTLKRTEDDAKKINSDSDTTADPVDNPVEDEDYLPDIDESMDFKPDLEDDLEREIRNEIEKDFDNEETVADAKEENAPEPESKSEETVYDEPPLENEESEPELDDSDNDVAYEIPVLGTNLTQEEYQALTKDLITEPSEEEFSEAQYTLPVVENTPAKIFSDGLSQRKPEKETPPTNYLKPLPSLPEKKEEPALKPAAGNRPMPEGLFSPETGFGWEEYMMPRLDSELMKSAASDQDISLFMLNIPKFDWTSEAGDEIIKIIEETFQFKDLIFEYGESGCSAIMQNMNITKALKTAEDLHTNIISTLAKRNIYRIVNMGISSRSLRMISGKRLANEAEQALLHAMNEKNTPIVAFKVNPEKYRKYIAREVAKLEENNA